jgi:hypothetical protein
MPFGCLFDCAAFGVVNLVEPQGGAEERNPEGQSLAPARQENLAVDATHTEVFAVDGFLDAVPRGLAADAALLHAAERGDLYRNDTPVAPD